MRGLTLATVTIMFTLLTGCAVGNKYDYQQADLSLPVKGDTQVSVGVTDKRDYVTRGDKPANFVGLQRGGFGNPFNVTTLSGRPLTEDMTTALERALRKSGYQVQRMSYDSTDSSLIASAIRKNGQEKNILLSVFEWKTDIYASMSLRYDLLLQVFDKQGQEIASATARSDGPETLSGGGFEAQNSRLAASAFETKVSRLFNNPQIMNALKN